MTNSNSKSLPTKLDTFQNETLPRAEETIKEWAAETSKFVKKHPLASVAGALVVGYLIGAAMKKSQAPKGRGQ